MGVRTLARHMSWMWKHPCFAKEWNLCLAHPMSRMWRYPCLLKGLSSGLPTAGVCMLMCIVTTPPHLTVTWVSVCAHVCVRECVNCNCQWEQRVASQWTMGECTPTTYGNGCCLHKRIWVMHTHDIRPQMLPSLKVRVSAHSQRTLGDVQQRLKCTMSCSSGFFCEQSTHGLNNRWRGVYFLC